MANFDFLKDEFPALAMFGNQADSYLESDPNSALIKIRMIGEAIVDMVFAYTGCPVPRDDRAFKKINVLAAEGYVPQQVASLLHEMRKRGNDAVHEGYASEEMAKTLARVAHSVCLWFALSYGKEKYSKLSYLDPSRQQVEQLGNVAEGPGKTPFPDGPTTEAEDERLVAQASERAKQAPRIPKAERRKRVAEAENQRPKTEAETRLIIDSQLRDAGWEADTEALRYSRGTRPKRGRNLAIAEWPTGSAVSGCGYADYALFIGESLVAMVEAKAEGKDIPAVIDVQGKEYASHVRPVDLCWCKHPVAAEFNSGTPRYQVPFTYATNGRPYLKQYETKSGIWALDLRDAANVPKPLQGWPSPQGLEDLLERDVTAANKRLAKDPGDLLRDPDGLNLRTYQINAIKAAERAVISGRKAALIAMATGTGKTRTALGMIYRFLSTERFRRILFLVDRDTLGEQADEAFKDIKIEQLMALDQIYEVQGLASATINAETRISIATVQSMVKRILYAEEEGERPAVTDFDLVIVDEAHRGYILDKEMTEEESLYRDQREYQSKYRAVIDYFDAVKIALTATPALHTTQIFGAPVFQYTYREAVIDGYLVDHDAPHRLRTTLTEEGIHYKAGDTVAVYDPETHELTNGAQLSDELDFDVDDFNRRVVDENFDRAVLAEIAANIDPEDPLQGKTLIYAVDDAHADLIVRILREIYAETGVDGDAIMKITAAAGGGNPKRVRELVRHFKNDQYPSIAVTVDLLTTGIDVPPITTLVFMRRVRSRILFEQMMGRATRLCKEIRKTHFEIYDPVGVYEALEPVTSMRPISVDPATTIGQLIDGFEYTKDKAALRAVIDRLAARVQRKVHAVSQKQLTALEGRFGIDYEDLIRGLRGEDVEAAREQVLEQQAALRALDEVHVSGGRAVVISDRPDELVSHTRDYGSGERPEDYLDAFTSYLKTGVNEVAALNLCVTRPADLTRQTLRDLELTLSRAGFTEQKLNTAVSQMTNQDMVADIISLVRRYAIGSPLVSHAERVQGAVARLKAAHQFTRQELTWLGRIENYLMHDSVLNADVFDDDERFRSKGGFKKVDKVFGGGLSGIIVELNTYLYDERGRAA